MQRSKPVLEFPNTIDVRQTDIVPGEKQVKTGKMNVKRKEEDGKSKERAKSTSSVMPAPSLGF